MRLKSPGIFAKVPKKHQQKPVFPRKRHTFCASGFQGRMQQPSAAHINYIGRFPAKIRGLSEKFELSNFRAKGIPFARKFCFPMVPKGKSGMPSLKTVQAAESCGMGRTSFRHAVMRAGLGMPRSKAERRPNKMTTNVPMGSRTERERVQAELKQSAKEILFKLSALESAQSKELLSDFVSELFLGVAQQSQREERRKKQAEGIAAARARGVRFGRTAKTLPDNFDEIRQAWRDGELSLQQAADACGVARSTFYGIATRREQAADQTA